MARPSHTENFNNDKKKLLDHPDDDDFIRELISELIRRKRHVKRPSKDHLKHRGVNYFHATGIITVDGEGRYYETGPLAFLKLLDLRYPKQLGPKINPFADLTDHSKTASTIFSSATASRDIRATTPLK